MTERILVRSVIVVLLVTTVVAAGASHREELPAAAQEAGVYAADFSPRSGPPGSEIMITGQCVEPGGQPATSGVASLTRDSDGQSVGSLEMDAFDTIEPGSDMGRFGGSLRVSPDAVPGPHTLTIGAFHGDTSCSPPDQGVLLQAAFTVTPGPEPSPMSIAPTSGPAGTTIHVVGSACPVPSERVDGAQYLVTVVFQVGAISAGFTAGVGHPGDTSGTVLVRSDGTWAAELRVDAVVPPGPAGIYADCNLERSGPEAPLRATGTAYTPVPFTVTPSRPLPRTS